MVSHALSLIGLALKAGLSTGPLALTAAAKAVGIKHQHVLASSFSLVLLLRE